MMSADAMTASTLDLDDIQAGVLFPRPSPYAGLYVAIRIDDPAAGRELLGRAIAPLTPAAQPGDPSTVAWLSVGLTFQGLVALGLPSESLDSFPEPFRDGMAARAADLGDVGESSPERWEAPLGTRDVHVVFSALAPDAARLDELTDRARDVLRGVPGVTPVWRQAVYSLPNERTSFGFKDGISYPAIEGSGIPGSNPNEVPLKAGEFVLGHTDETGNVAAIPQPDILGRNGSYLVFRKLHTRVAAFRQYLRAKSTSREDEELLAAKFVGRWPSGAPLALAPDRDDPELGADPNRNNAFSYGDDPRGLKCPLGAHARRMNARDSLIIGEVRLHRMIRRGASYGPMLTAGVLDDDGADRGIVFACICAHLDRQFEFVKTEWVNDGKFFGTPEEQDPLAGMHDAGHDRFTVPREPIRRRLPQLPQFVVNRGGDYCFLPSLSALRWIAT